MGRIHFWMSRVSPRLNSHLKNSHFLFTIMTTTLFNTSLKQLQKKAALIAPQTYLKDEIAARLCDRLFDIKRTFPRVLDVGSGMGHVLKHSDPTTMESLTCLESCKEMLHYSQSIPHSLSKVEFKCPEEDSVLPFPENSFDAVLSSCSLHWKNDLLGSLIQIKNILKPDGLFLGCLFGGETLYELRTCLQLAELERKGGISPHVSPMIRDRDMGSLLTRAGFSLITVDVDEICVEFPSMFELIQDLQAMGENNALNMPQFPTLSKQVLLSASAIYQQVYGNESSIPATFQKYIGWKPDASQPKPLERGSGEISMKTLESKKSC